MNNPPKKGGTPFSPQLGKAIAAGINNKHSKWSKSPGGDHRSDFIDYISGTLHIRKEFAYDLVQGIFEIIIRELENGGRFVFPNIGAVSTRPKRYAGRAHNIQGTIIAGRGVHFRFHHAFNAKITGKTNHNDKYNKLASEKKHAWREMYRPDLHEKAILRAEEKAGRRSSYVVPVRERGRKKRLRKVGSGIRS